MLRILNLTFIIISVISVQAQVKTYIPTVEDKAALEGIIVEKYYVSTADDTVGTNGSLPIGSITYRIFVDLKPGYKLEAVYGDPVHELNLKTTTTFFNNLDGGAKSGEIIDSKNINKTTVALDSWLSMGAANDFYWGIPLSDDKDGSIITTRKSLAKADGFLYGNVPATAYYGIDLNAFNKSKNSSNFSTNNGCWANMLGVIAPKPENKILIAQLTTDGKLSFELNIQIGTPKGNPVKFVAKNPADNEIKFDGLTY